MRLICVWVSCGPAINNFHTMAESFWLWMPKWLSRFRSDNWTFVRLIPDHVCVFSAASNLILPLRDS